MTVVSRARVLEVVAVLLLVGGGVAPGARRAAAEDPAAAPAPELEKARAQLAKRADAAIQTLASSPAKGAIALLDVRPEQDLPELRDACTALQPWLVARLLLGGVLVFRLEAETASDVAYEGGRLPKGPLLPARALAGLAERGVGWVGVPRLVADADGATARIEVYDVRTRARTSKVEVGPIPTKAFPIAELCAPDPLPPRNVKILLYAVEHLGKQAGRGECGELPWIPIQADGGVTSGYQFGTEIPWKEGRPGDVVTFGASGETGGHVVVLLRWEADRSKSTILHQNWAGKRFVVQARLADVEGSKKGQALRLWRP